MKIDEKLFQIALTQIEGIGPRFARNLISHYGTAQEVIENNHKHKDHIEGMGTRYLKQIRNGMQSAVERAKESVLFSESRGVNILSIDCNDYPQRLKNCCDAPLILYSTGNGNLNMDYVISVVGTRKASEYGKRMTQDFIEQAREYNVGVISGLAYGIDIEAHRSCLYHQVPTFAVLAHGLDRIYPASHRQYARQIIDNGLLVSEFPEGTRPDRENFPKRNRIVAGMSDATVVVESGLKGGSIITAYLANDYNRDVFAFPGRVGDVQSIGTNHLIKIERSRLVECMDDLAYFMEWNTVSERKKHTKPKIDLSSDEEKIVRHLDLQTAIHIDELVQKTDFGIGKTLVLLTGLELKGICLSKGGQRYQLD